MLRCCHTHDFSLVVDATSASADAARHGEGSDGARNVPEKGMTHEAGIVVGPENIAACVDINGIQVSAGRIELCDVAKRVAEEPVIISRTRSLIPAHDFAAIVHCQRHRAPGSIGGVKISVVSTSISNEAASRFPKEISNDYSRITNRCREGGQRSRHIYRSNIAVSETKEGVTRGSGVSFPVERRPLGCNGHAILYCRVEH